MEATTNGHSPSPSTGASDYDADLDLLYAWMSAPTPAPQPCPEAAFSLTLKGTLDGVEALLTARGQTAAEFKANLEAIRWVLDQPTVPQTAAAPTEEAGGWCAVHDTAMKAHHGKDGRRWFSHYLPEGGWCKGK
jgi:hypothetical protein